MYCKDFKNEDISWWQHWSNYYKLAVLISVVLHVKHINCWVYYKSCAHSNSILGYCATNIGFYIYNQLYTCEVTPALLEQLSLQMRCTAHLHNMHALQVQRALQSSFKYFARAATALQMTAHLHEIIVLQMQRPLLMRCFCAAVALAAHMQRMLHLQCKRAASVLQFGRGHHLTKAS